ncbi:DUF461 domain-containing protein [Streptomyces sp. T-3]|nr:DUF461 domain-containing protein [Streptomyces sp. T-3]
MSRSLRRGALAATALAFSIATLAACGAGNDAQTLGVRPDNAATSVDDGMIKIQNALVITQPELESTGPAVVSATLFNNGDKPQTLDSVKIDGTAKEAKLSAAKGGGDITIPAGGSIVLGGEGNPSAVLPSSREAVKDGNAQAVTFTFSKSGNVTLKTFVVPATSYFDKWGPSDIPEAPDAKPSQSGKPSGSATPSGSASDDPSGEAVDGASGAPSGSASHSASTGTGTGH